MNIALYKLIKLSDPINPDETFFIWPEGIFSGFYYREIYKFKDFFKKNFKDNHKIILGINTFDEINNKYYNSLIVVDNNFEVIHRYNKKKLFLQKLENQNTGYDRKNYISSMN